MSKTIKTKSADVSLKIKGQPVHWVTLDEIENPWDFIDLTEAHAGAQILRGKINGVSVDAPKPYAGAKFYADTFDAPDEPISVSEWARQHRGPQTVTLVQCGHCGTFHAGSVACECQGLPAR